MKIKIALFFSVLFVSVLIAPTVISLIDDSQDIALFLKLNEEEEKENKGKEESKIDNELKIHSSSFSALLSFNHIDITKNIRFYSKNYVSEFPKITTPPPKFML